MCILGGILCDLELQESEQETRYRPGKQRVPGLRPRPTLSPGPHSTVRGQGHTSSLSERSLIFYVGRRLDFVMLG